MRQNAPAAEVAAAIAVWALIEMGGLSVAAGGLSWSMS